MKMQRTKRAFILLALVSAVACGRPPGVPEPLHGDSQKLPFDREPSSTGLSPSKSLIPATTFLPEGTALVFRIGKSLSSASAHANDTFTGTLDDPVIVEEQTLIPASAAVTGRVLDARSSKNFNDPGYLRIALVSIEVDGKTIPIDTNSIFVKASHRSAGVPANVAAANLNDVVFSPDRRLTFRLARTVDIR